MATSEQVLPLDEALTQLRIRAGVDDEMVTGSIPVAIQLFEQEIGHALIDVEVSGEMPAPRGESSIYIPHAAVYGVVLGTQALKPLRDRLVSIIDEAIAEPIADPAGTLLTNTLTALRDRLALVFDYEGVTEIAEGVQEALADANYTPLSRTLAAHGLWSQLLTLARDAGQSPRFNPTTGYTKIDAPDDDWADELKESEEPVRYHAFVGTPFVDISEVWRNSIKLLLSYVYHTRGGLEDDPKDVRPLALSMVVSDRVIPASGDGLNAPPYDIR